MSYHLFLILMSLGFMLNSRKAYVALSNLRVNGHSQICFYRIAPLGNLNTKCIHLTLKDPDFQNHSTDHDDSE